MPSKKNISEVENLATKLEKSKSVVLADYKGLTVAQITKLRNQISDSGAEMKVTKNTLLSLALTKAGFPKEEIKDQLLGPTATIFSYEDEVAPLKITAEFGKDNQFPSFKAGFLGKTFLSADKVKELSQLPSREVLLAKLVGTLNAPLYGLAVVLQGNLRKLVYVLKAIEKNKN